MLKTRTVSRWSSVLPKLLISLGLIGVLALVAACGSDPTATPTPTRASAATTPTPQASAFDLLLAEAKKEFAEEPLVEIWFSIDDPLPQLWADQFNARFGTNIRIEGLDIGSSEATTRAIAEHQAGRTLGDLNRSGQATFTQVLENNTALSVDWVGVFGDELPGIAEPADVSFPELAGFSMQFRDNLRDTGYRTDRVSESDLPKEWEGFLDPKWKGRMVIEGRGFPFNYMVWMPGWNEDRVEAFVRGLLDNDALVVARCRGGELIRGEVDVQIGCGGAQALLANDPSLPINFYLVNPTPLSRVVAWVPAKPKHPNGAQLFTAWASTEGMDAFEQVHVSNRITNPNSKIFQNTLANHNPFNAEWVTSTSFAQEQAADEFRSKISEIIAGTQ